MDEKFSNKTAKIFAIESSAGPRLLMTEVLKSMGFQNVQGLTSIKDVIEHLEVEPPDWIITPMLADQPENALALLKLCTIHPELKNIRISLLLEDSEKAVLPTAFSLGLISWHAKTFTKDTCTETFGSLWKMFEEANWNLTLVAAEFLRQTLRQENDLKSWLQFEKNLSEIYPGMPNLMLNLAEPQILSGDREGGKSILRQVLLLDSSLETKVKEVKNKHLGESEELTSAGASVNVLGLKNVVVVDPDETIQKALTEIFNELGVTDVQIFNDGEAAAAWVKDNPNPGLVVQEWRIPKLTGPLFLQRIISEGAVSTPIVILSSLVKNDDMALVREMGIANIFSKPFDKTEFLKSLVWTIQQERLPSEHSSVERKIRNCLKAKKLQEASELVAKFIADEAIPKAKRKLIEAEHLFATNDLLKARDNCIESIHLAGDSILSLNLLGKTLMRLQDFPAALKCLEKAQSLSPLNIERLCSIAEVQTELGNEDKAKEALNDAKDIDPDSEKIQEAEVNVAMSSGDLDGAKKLMGQLDSLDNLFAYMNNKAVALARCDKVPEGIEQYKKIIDALPDNAGDLKTRVRYNLALAFARSGELENAKGVLEEVAKAEDKKIKQKSKSLKQRIEQALTSGGDFHLIETPTATPTDAAAAPNSDAKEAIPGEELKAVATNDSAVAGVMARRGEIGCYLIYNLQGTSDELSQKLLAVTPTFYKRKVLERAETVPAQKKSA